MTVEAALKQQGIDPASVSPNTKAQLQNVLLQKGKDVLFALLAILLNQNRQTFSNATTDAELQAKLEVARIRAESEAKAAAEKKKRQTIYTPIGVVVGSIVAVGVYVFIKKRKS